MRVSRTLGCQPLALTSVVCPSHLQSVSSVLPPPKKKNILRENLHHGIRDMMRCHGSGKVTLALQGSLRGSDVTCPSGILWRVLREYGVRGPLLRAVRSLYDRSRSLVRIAGSKSDLFPVHVGLQQGCPLSPVLFIIFMDRISRRSQGPEGVGFGDHAISSLLFADDVVVLATSDQDLQHALERFAAECEAVGMRISASKSEAMVLSRKRVACPLQVGGVLLPQVEEFTYLGVLSRVREGWNGRLTDGSVQLLH